jgi:hypothetical protein
MRAALKPHDCYPEENQYGPHHRIYAGEKE